MSSENIEQIPFHSKKLGETLDIFSTDKELGIHSSKVAGLHEKYGYNKIIQKPPSIWKVYLAPLFDTLITIYLIMAGILSLLSAFVPGVRGQVTFWIIIIALNMILAIFQQYRAQKKVDALKKLSPQKANVIRDGLEIEVLSENLIPGDIIILGLGDKIPADARLIETNNLSIDEASLTGESVPIQKFRTSQLNSALPAETPIGERGNMIYLGTFIQTGSAKAVVCQIGNNTELGKISSKMDELTEVEIPLRTKINALGRGLGILMSVFLAIAIIVKFWIRMVQGSNFTIDQIAKDIADSIVNAMAVMPINIPLLTTVVLITGVLQMATKQVIVKELSAVETLGRTSVLCSDKTGTMTTSKMTVVKFWNRVSMVDVNAIDGTVETYVDGKEVSLDKIIKDENNKLFLYNALLNNSAKLVETSDPEHFDIAGNPTDGALLTLCVRIGLPIRKIKDSFVQIKSYPFDSKVKRMSGVFEDKSSKQLLAFTKGASDILLPLCTQIKDSSSSTKLTKKKRDEILSQINKLANQGYRIISLAYKTLDSIPEDEDDLVEERKRIESDLTYLGYTVILDPPRPGVKEAVAKLDSAGIFPVMITGDAPSTAGTIAQQVGILDPDELVIEGKEIMDLNDEDFLKVSVFARVSPQDKQVIVERYQDVGKVVTMTGDGVNDSLAIAMADAGVAMGITGTEVTKEAADMIIADDSYVSLVTGVEEGRNLFEKIRIMIFFYIAVNFAEAIMYFSTQFLMEQGNFLQLLNNYQRTYIFSIVHALPPLAIIFGNNDWEIMKLKPREQAAILSKRMIQALILYSLLSVSGILLVYFMQDGNFLGWLGVSSFNKLGFNPEFRTPDFPKQPIEWTQAKARTMLLSVIYISETFMVISIRRMNRSFIQSLRDSNLFILAMVFSPLIIHFGLMYIFPIQYFIGYFGINIDLIFLDPLDLFIVFFFGLLPVAALEIFKKFVREKGEQF